MKIYFDTEFIEDGSSIELISIGLVREDGAELYYCNSECDLSRANDWVKKHVIPQLPPREAVCWQDRKTIAEAIKWFVQADLSTHTEFWAYYADYDWVLLCQLFGTMMQLPQGFPMMCMDLMQLALDRRICRPGESLKVHVPQPRGEHDALCDARWNKVAHEYLRRRIGGLR